MDQEHRSVLKRNRVKLIEGIADPLGVADALFANGVFTDSMKQEVEAEKTPNGKVRKILDIVPKRGQQAFDKFHEALLISNNTDAADLLKPELAGTHAPATGQMGYAPVVEGTDLPAVWPSEEDMNQPVQVKSCDVRSQLVTMQWQNKNVYSMKKQKRGRCVIISNQVFKGPLKKDSQGVLRCILPARLGTAKDVMNLTHLFKQFHFDVAEHTEKKAQEIEELLKSEARHSDHKDAECFVLIICSHGTTTGIYGVDGKIISHEEVFAIFNSQNCQNLAGKPKLIFLQACHGEKVDHGGVSNRNEADAETFGEQDGDTQTAGIQESLEELQLGNGQGDQTEGDNAGGEDMMDAERLNSIPSYTDFLVVRATHPGFVSFRNTVFGSWFIQAVVWVFQRYACEKDIFHLLVLVNQLVSKGRTQQGTQELMQASRFDSSLRKTMYFFPGIVASDS